LTNTIDNPTIDDPRLLKGRHHCEECDSSDSMGYYEDHATCFGACNKTWFYTGVNTKVRKEIEPIDFEEIIERIKDINELPVRGVRDRKLTIAAMDVYGVKSEIKEDGTPGSRYYPWYVDGKLVAYKQKTVDKGFYLKGDTQFLNRPKSELFGQSKFSAGGKTLVIVEGEDDAVAMQQAYLDKYKKPFPVVSVFNSKDTSSVVKNIAWVNSFEKVILWPDNDGHGAGMELMETIAKAIGPGKAFIVGEKTYKDANAALIAKDGQYLINQIWNCTPYAPAGFVSGEELWTRFKDRENIPTLPYPDCLSGVNQKLKGMRKGEIVLLVSGTGSGKTTVTKEIMLHIIKNPDEKLGIISLEEDVGESVQKLIEMYLGLSVMDDEKPVPESEKRRAFDAIFGDIGQVIILDHQGSVSDQSLIDKMRAMCAMGINNIILDHITIAVSEGNEGLTGNEAIDKMMSDLLKLVKGWPVWLGVISHLRKTGSGNKSFEEGHMPSMDDIKGSGSIKQICFDILAFSRDMGHENERMRNTTNIQVLKARTTGKTGPAGRVYYDHDKRRLEKIAATSTESADDLFSKFPEKATRIYSPSTTQSTSVNPRSIGL